MVGTLLAASVGQKQEDSQWPPSGACKTHVFIT